MRRIRCSVEYDGTAYAGFQRQPHRLSVQGMLEQAISAVTQEHVCVAGAGRTDAGAHALDQVVAFSTASALSLDTLQRAINAHLPSDIAISSIADASLDFHPRFDATSRVYRYLIWNRPVPSPFYKTRAMHVARPLDETAMQRALQVMVGEHDFTSFSPANFAGNRSRIMYAATCRREGDLIVIELEANGFMRQMVRSIVGTLILVGRGKHSPEEVGAILAAKDRRLAGPTVPAHGLYLIQVRYAGESHLHEPMYPARPALTYSALGDHEEQA